MERGELYCIGDIVHNDLEVRRLEEKGLRTIEHGEFAGLRDCRVLFRAHGEPPESYRTARENGVEVIDASCPVVLDLQRRIREAYEAVSAEEGQVVIYGKRGHAEVVGAVGVEKEEDWEQVDFGRKVVLFSQTTQNLEGFRRIAEWMRERGGERVVVHDTICRKVANRISQLKEFAGRHDVVIFVSGEKSSNGRQLFSVCKEVNPRSYFVQEAADVTAEMTAGAESVGISGATSTPRRVMEEIQRKIERQ